MIHIEYIWQCLSNNAKYLFDNAKNEGLSYLFECEETLKMGVNETVI